MSLIGPRSASGALDNAWHAAHRGDTERVKYWVEQAQEYIDEHDCEP